MSIICKVWQECHHPELCQNECFDSDLKRQHSFNDECNDAVKTLLKQYGMKILLESVILQIDQFAGNDTDYLINLAADLRNALDKYEARY